MIGLLPKVYSQEFKKEKIIKRIFIVFILWGLFLAFGVVFLLPSYFTLVFSLDDVLRSLGTEEVAIKRKNALRRQILCDTETPTMNAKNPPPSPRTICPIATSENFVLPPVANSPRLAERNISKPPNTKATTEKKRIRSTDARRNIHTV